MRFLKYANLFFAIADLGVFIALSFAPGLWGMMWGLDNFSPDRLTTSIIMRVAGAMELGFVVAFFWAYFQPIQARPLYLITAASVGFSLITTTLIPLGSGLLQLNKTVPMIILQLFVIGLLFACYAISTRMGKTTAMAVS